MKKKLFLVYLICFIILYTQLQATLLWLKDETLLQGDILDNKEDTIIFKRFDNQGVVELSWSIIHPISLKRIQEQLGIKQNKKPAYKVKGVKVYLKVGGVVMGKLVKRENNRIIIKNKTRIFPIPVSNILKQEEVKIPISELYKPEDLYNKVSKQYNLSTLQGNLKLVKFLIQVNNFKKAKLHLEKAQELQKISNDDLSTLIKKYSQEILEKQNNKKLRILKIYRNTNRFKKALEILKDLQDSMSQEKLKYYRNDILSRQSKYLRKEIPREWIRRVSKKISKITLNSSTGLNKACQYASIDMQKEIIDELSKKFNVTQQELKNYLKTREKKNHYSFSYGTGTFIVGISGRQGENDKPKTFESWRQNKQNYGTNDSKLLTPDEWWKSVNSSVRQEWLKAYYFEKYFIVTKQKLVTCPYCDGKGTSFSNGKHVFCPGCHGLRYQRTVIVK